MSWSYASGVAYASSKAADPPSTLTQWRWDLLGSTVQKAIGRRSCCWIFPMSAQIWSRMIGIIECGPRRSTQRQRAIAPSWKDMRAADIWNLRQHRKRYAQNSPRICTPRSTPGPRPVVFVPLAERPGDALEPYGYGKYPSWAEIVMVIRYKFDHQTLRVWSLVT